MEYPNLQRLRSKLHEAKIPSRGLFFVNERFFDKCYEEYMDYCYIKNGRRGFPLAGVTWGCDKWLKQGIGNMLFFNRAIATGGMVLSQITSNRKA